MTLEAWLQILLFLSIAGLGLYFRSYLRKKAENLATKEDIGVITKQVEFIKGEIGAQLYVHQMRYQNEFQLLKALSEKIIDLRNSALSLRPVIDSFDPNEPEDERKKRRLDRYFEAGRALYQLSEAQKPFYPEEIYEAVSKLDKTVWKEVVGYKLGSEKSPSFDHKKYWDQAADNAKEITSIVDEVMGLIRKRIQYWESFALKADNA